MIKRSYFFSVKVSCKLTGIYSFWAGVVQTKRWVFNMESVLDDIRDEAADKFYTVLNLEVKPGDIQVISFNRI